MSNFTDKARKAFLALLSVAALAPLTANAVDTINVTPEQDGTISQGMIFSASNRTCYPVVPSTDGYLIAYINSSSYTAFQGVPNVIWYTQDIETSYTSNDNYDYLQSLAAAQTYEKLYDGDTSTIGDIEGPAQLWIISEAKANTTYYFYVSTASNYSSGTFTIKLIPDGSVTPEPDPVEINVNTPVQLAKDEKGIFQWPEELPKTSAAQFTVITNSPKDIRGTGNSFLYESKNCSTDPITMTGSEQDGVWVYTFSIYVSNCPLYLSQSVMDEVTYTFTSPALSVTPVQLDNAFEATKDYRYSFSVDSDCKVEFKTSIELDNKANNMVYSDEACSTVVKCTNAQDPGFTDGVYSYVYVLEKAGTYYFKCGETGSYTISKVDETVTAEPSDIDAKIVVPYVGSQQVTSFAISWNDQTLTDGIMRGIVVTLPTGVEVPVRLSLTGKDGSTAMDQLALNFVTPATYDIRGDYTIYLPEGVVLIDGHPNKEQTLTYTLVPDADEGEKWFTDDSFTLDPEKDAELSLLGNVTITYVYDLFKVPAKNYDEDGNVIDSPEVDENDKDVTVSVNNVLTKATIDGKSIVIPVNMAATDEEVTVTIKIGAGIVKNEDGEINYAETIVYTLVPEETEDPGQDPGDEPTYVGGATAIEVVGEEGITAIKINWEDNELYLNDVDDIITVESSSDNNPSVIGVSIEDNVYLVLTFAEPFAEEASLTITIPEGYVTVGEEGVYNAFQQLILTTTGVAFVGVDSEFGQVYNLQGVKMNVKKASELPAGLYIIDGKKVVIRK